MELSAAIEAALHDSDKASVQELSLDRRMLVPKPDFSPLKEFTSLDYLSACFCGIHSIESIPRLSNVHKCELNDNRTSTTKVQEELSVSNNKIATLDEIRPLIPLTRLRALDLFENPLTKIDGYRDKVFEMLPHLVYLDRISKDGKDMDDEEGEEEEDEYENEESEGADDAEGETPADKAGNHGEAEGAEEEEAGEDAGAQDEEEPAEESSGEEAPGEGAGEEADGKDERSRKHERSEEEEVGDGEKVPRGSSS